MSDALQRIAELAPTLKESEVRVLLELSRRVAESREVAIAISSRELAEATNLSRSNTRLAISWLNNRGIITSDRGSATVAATHKLNFLQTVRLERGPVTGPPPIAQVGLFQAQGGPVTSPPLDSLQAQGGPTTSPPSDAANNACVRAPTFDTFEFDSFDVDRTLERLIKATPAHYDAARLQEARKWLHGYMAKFGT